jgi:uncharacterized damage-inducible protein DinB
MVTGTSSEREVLESFLDFHRESVVRKVADLSAPAATQRLVPSRTTLAGLLRHLAVTERQWFQQVLSGHPAPAGEGAQDPDTSWVVSDADTVPGLIAAYQQACGQSRVAAMSRDLNDTVPHPVLGEVSLRWIYVHMIEETARHAGHADILRELTDGTTGVV